MNATHLKSFLALAGGMLISHTVLGNEPDTHDFNEASDTIEKRLEESAKELAELMEAITKEKLPLSRDMNRLESELREVRDEFQRADRLLTTRKLDLSSLTTDIKNREATSTYISDLLNDYRREFQSILHISEDERYAFPIEAANLALDNKNLTPEQTFDAQMALLDVSLARLDEALGGARFEGNAIDSSGYVNVGTFILVGPAALFESSVGNEVGTAEMRVGSQKPTIIRFSNPKNLQQASDVIATSRGLFPLDPTLGNAHKIAATEKETIIDEVKKGGNVMIPIIALAGLALIVAIWKWTTLTLVRKPSKRRIQDLLEAISTRDIEGVKDRVSEIKGPVGRMLTSGVDHIRESRDIIEEAMYETVLTTRLKLQRLLPFIAICAAAAPLLGLLGTVTGIISTFKMITIFGSGDVKMLSGGISEALITTKYGLIVAIPALLIHSFLSRKARGIVAQMESAGVAFVNQVNRTPLSSKDRSHDVGNDSSTVSVDAQQVRTHVREMLADLLGPMMNDGERFHSPTSQPAP